jgi:CheY-like chemotaxis protein
MSQRQIRVIVVEDHAASAEGLNRFLCAVGYKVFVATDMSSALSLASAVEFDVLLSDLALPDGSGWELMKRLSAERRIRGIAFSGHNSPDDLQRSAEAGFLEHISKPLSPEKLCAAIDRAAATV